MIIQSLCAFAFVVVLALPTVSYAVPTVSVGSATVNGGDTFTIPVSITDAVDLTSWQFDLSFDPTSLQANSVTEGPFLSSSGTKTTLFSPGVIDNGTGLISLVTDSYVDLPPGPSGAGVLANIEFSRLPPRRVAAFLVECISGFFRHRLSGDPRTGDCPGGS